MNFSQSVKLELNRITEMSDCCALSELSGILHTAGSIVRNSAGLGVEIVSQSDMSPFLSETLGNLYGTELEVKWENNAFGGNNVYAVPVQIAKSVLTDCGIIRYDETGNIALIAGIDPYLVQEDCCRAAFIRGAFLGGGSIADPVSGSFHLEFVMNAERLADDLEGLLAGLDIKAGRIVRRGKSVVYVKGGDKISDILALAGAGRAVLRLNEQMVLRDVKNRINRGNNCFNANTDKMIGAELRQLEAIRYIRDTAGLMVLPDNLRRLADYRLAHENVSYESMAAGLGIPKSTLSRRLKKIMETAEKLRGNSDV